MTQQCGFLRHLIWQQSSHNPEVAGSNPAPATRKALLSGVFPLQVRRDERDSEAEDGHEIVVALLRLREIRNADPVEVGAGFGFVETLCFRNTGWARLTSPLLLTLEHSRARTLEWAEGRREQIRRMADRRQRGVMSEEEGTSEG